MHWKVTGAMKNIKQRKGKGHAGDGSVILEWPGVASLRRWHLCKGSREANLKQKSLHCL